MNNDLIDTIKYSDNIEAKFFLLLYSELKKIEYDPISMELPIERFIKNDKSFNVRIIDHLIGKLSGIMTSIDYNRNLKLLRMLPDDYDIIVKTIESNFTQLVENSIKTIDSEMRKKNAPTSEKQNDLMRYKDKFNFSIKFNNEEKQILQKYCMVIDNGERSYIYRLTNRDLNWVKSGGVPSYFSCLDFIWSGTSWKSLMTDFIVWYTLKSGFSNDKYLEIQSSWSKQSIFSEEFRINYLGPFKNKLYVNGNHTSLHMWWLILDLVDMLVDPGRLETYVLVHYPTALEPKEVSELIWRKEVTLFKEYLSDQDYSEQQIRVMVENLKRINTIFKKVAPSYFFTHIDRRKVLYNAISKIKKTRRYIAKEFEYRETLEKFVDFKKKLNYDNYNSEPSLVHNVKQKSVTVDFLYWRYRSEKGRVLTRTEFYASLSSDEYDSIKKLKSKNPFKNYYEFLKEVDSEFNLNINNSTKDFVNMIETTNFTRLYKIPIFQAFIYKGKFRYIIKKFEIIESFRDFYANPSNYLDIKNLKSRGGFDEYSDDEVWRLAIENPIHFLCLSHSDIFAEVFNGIRIILDFGSDVNNVEVIDFIQDAISFRRTEFIDLRLNK